MIVHHSLRPLLAAVLFGAVLPAGLHAQTYWRIPTTIGYGGLGVGVGVLSLWALDVDIYDDATLWGPLAGLSAGGMLGYWIGKRADDALARGDELGAVHHAAVRMGTGLTGAAAGVIPAVILINADAASWLGTDEAIFVGSLLAGAGAGVLVQLALESKLRPGATVRSGMRLLPSGAPAVVVSIAY